MEDFSLIHNIEERLSKLNSLSNFQIHNNIEVTQVGAGKARGIMRAEDFHLNPYGIIHGGAMFSLADTVAGATLMYVDKQISTVTASVNYTAPGLITDEIIADSEIIKDGRTISVVDIVIRNQEDKVLLSGQFTFYKS